MNRRKVLTQVLLSFFIMMFLMLIGCSSDGSNNDRASIATPEISETVTGDTPADAHDMTSGSGETASDCSSDSGTCGNMTSESGATPSNCPSDSGTHGNMTMGSETTPSNCSSDSGTHGHMTMGSGTTPSNCSSAEHAEM